MITEFWLETDEQYLAGVLPRCSSVVAERGVGSWLWDVDGNKFLDFTSGIGVTSVGHCHPKVVAAICGQSSKLIHTSVTTHNTLNIQLAKRLSNLCPFFEDAQVFFCNSGAEAVDGALKLARVVTGKHKVVAFQDAFHGRTLGATSITTAKEKYYKPYEPLLPSIIITYGSGLYTLEELQHRSYPPQIGAMIVEPVLGEGGYILPPAGWLQDLRDYCDEYNIMLIFDEVQCGIGRTGNMWAAETFGVTPDVILSSKALASGLPLGAIIAPKSIMSRWPEGTHGTTFGGNPVACAAALATLDIIEPLLPRVREKGKWALDKLSQWNARGIGYMIGIPLGSKRIAERVQKECLDNNLLVLLCGPDEDIVRLIPPLNVTDAEWTIALDTLEKSLK